MDRKQAGGVMCSEIVDLDVQSRKGRKRKLLKVNIEEIWSSGAIFCTDSPIPRFNLLRFGLGDCEFRGQVIARASIAGLGYFVEMQFDPGCMWSEQKYRPKHLFNPAVLLANRIFERTVRVPINPPDGLFLATFATSVGMDSFPPVPAQSL